MRYGDVVAVRGVDLESRAGEIVALMGRNGSGKSSLLWALQGAGRRQRGTVDVAGGDPASRRDGARALVGLVPQTPPTCSTSRPSTRSARGRPRAGAAGRAPAARCSIGIVGPASPRPAPPRPVRGPAPRPRARGPARRRRRRVVLLDEPTRGLDYAAKDRLVGVLAELAADGHAVVSPPTTSSSSPRSPTGSWCSPTARSWPTARPRTSSCASPVFAPQVAKVLAPAAAGSPSTRSRRPGAEVGPDAR